MTTIPLNGPIFAMIESPQALGSDFDVQCEKTEEIESLVIKGKKLSTPLNLHPSSSSCDLSIKKVESIVNTAIAKTDAHSEIQEIKEEATLLSPFENTVHDIKLLIISNLDKKSRASFMNLNRKSAHQVHSLAKKELRDKMNSLLATLDKLHYQSEITELSHFIENPNSPFNQNSLTFQRLEQLVHQKVHDIFKNKINGDHPELTSNPLLMLMMVTQNGWLLQDASEELRKNPEIVKAAVTQDGFVLQHASPELQNHFEIVKAAVSQNGLALRYASLELKNHFEIVKAAVSQNGAALRHASKELQNNLEIVKAAVSQNRNAIAFASAEMRNHPEIQQILNRAKPMLMKP